MPTKTKTEPAVPDQAAAGVPPMTLEWLDPGTLLADRNERTALRVNSEFVDSIREHGVLIPLSAERTPEGQVRIRHGHRRAFAAIQAGQPLGPVLVPPAGDESAAADIDRILSQQAAHHLREGPTEKGETSLA